MAYSIVGYIMGFIIYVTMFIYGAIVMQGVMEEKSSRVVEIMVSSVRPFQLLMGKVLGIGAMGLVQMTLWSVLVVAGLAVAGSVAALFIDPTQLNVPMDATQQELLEAASFSLPQIAPSIFVWFLLYFLGGYLLYASLFAAIGSAVEQQQDAQGLMYPVSLLIIVPLIFMSFMLESPHSTLSVVLSMVPFFSPILMVVRIAVTEVPFWQSGGAFLLLAATFVGAVWVSARIYRVGILMYGKKPNLRDLVRWVGYA
jgi:ABC-2 type transport system permease protein